MTRRASFQMPTRDPGRPKVPDVKPLVQAYYRKPGNGAGGSLHVVLDDGNIGDDILQVCIDDARIKGDGDAVRIGELMLQMTKTQRRKL